MGRGEGGKVKDSKSFSVHLFQYVLFQAQTRGKSHLQHSCSIPLIANAPNTPNPCLIALLILKPIDSGNAVKLLEPTATKIRLNRACHLLPQKSASEVANIGLRDNLGHASDLKGSGRKDVRSHEAFNGMMERRIAVPIYVAKVRAVYPHSSAVYTTRPKMPTCRNRLAILYVGKLVDSDNWILIEESRLCRKWEC